jgi:hypothetical protein
MDALLLGELRFLHGELRIVRPSVRDDDADLEDPVPGAGVLLEELLPQGADGVVGARVGALLLPDARDAFLDLLLGGVPEMETLGI